MRTIRACVMLAAAAFGGCASVSRFNGIDLDHDALYVSDVAPFRQNRTHACGAACLAAVATHWGVTPAAFMAKYPGAAADATGADLEAMARDLGLQAFAYRGSMEDLRENLQKGRPVIAMIPMPMLPRGGLVAGSVFNLWNELGPRPPHWVVVVGTQNSRLIVNDPAAGPLFVQEENFESWWARNDHLCVLVAGTGPAGRGL